MAVPELLRIPHPIFHRAVVFALVVYCGLFFPSCNRKPTAPRHAKAAAKAAPRAVDAAVRDAREQMLAGGYEEAAEVFEELDARTNVPQPLHNWITLHLGLCHLLAGNDEGARAAFAKIQERGLFSTKKEDVKMAEWFMETSRLMLGEGPIPASVARNYDKWNHEAMALLLLALKNWNAEHTQEAIALFRQFQSSAPKSTPLWIGGPPEVRELRNLARSYASDHIEFRSAMQALRAARTPEEKKEALDVVKAARAQMTAKTRMTAALDERIAELEPEAAALVARQEKMAAAAESYDANTLPGAKKKRAELMAQYEFEEARKAIADPQFQTEEALEEQEKLAKKSQWLSNFKSQLVTDVAKGYAAPIPQKDGEQITGGVVNADDTHLHLRVPRGTKIPWSDLPPEALITMAKSFIPEDMPPFLAAFRNWNLGVFMAYAGKSAEARPHLEAAAEVMGVFQDEIPLALEFPEKQ